LIRERQYHFLVKGGSNSEHNAEGRSCNAKKQILILGEFDDQLFALIDFEIDRDVVLAAVLGLDAVDEEEGVEGVADLEEVVEE
jgi:hypothetical protein